MGHGFLSVSLGFLLASLPAFGAGTNCVWSGGNGTPPYDTWATAATNLQTAIDYAGTNLATYDTVVVTNGTYTVAAGIMITNGVTVVGFGGRDGTFVNGNGLSGAAIFTLSNAAAAVTGFTITNGANRGVYVHNGTVRDCAIMRNSGPMHSGSGFYIASGIISNCLIAFNSNSGHGGGGYADGGTIADCVISNNTSGSAGAGVCCGSTTPILERCRIIGNTGNNEGGGLYSGTARNCLIARNATLSQGGGMIISFCGLWDLCWGTASWPMW